WVGREPEANKDCGGVQATACGPQPTNPGCYWIDLFQRCGLGLALSFPPLNCWDLSYGCRITITIAVQGQEFCKSLSCFLLPTLKNLFARAPSCLSRLGRGEQVKNGSKLVKNTGEFFVRPLRWLCPVFTGYGGLPSLEGPSSERALTFFMRRPVC
ncbi:unnamed protein product, partial [Discosporangium mesarthrocarpum]